jgi:hypothetical protein
MKLTGEIKLDALRREIALGLDDFAHGRFQTYTENTLIQLANDIRLVGRNRLKVVAKVRGKKK